MKKGQAAVIVIILLILLSIVALVVFWNVFGSFTDKSNEEINLQRECLQNAKLSIVEACYTERFQGIWEIEALVKNTNDQMFNATLVSFITIEGNSDRIVFERKVIEPLGQKKFIGLYDKNPGNAQAAVIVQSIITSENEIHYCHNQAIPISLKEC